MKGKMVSVIITASPFDNPKATEAMRMGVGLTLRIPLVHLILLGDGLDVLQCHNAEKGHDADIIKHLTSFIELGLPVIVEKESMESRQGLLADWDLQIWSRDRITELITQCDGVVCL
jgi:hypothetical protein